MHAFLVARYVALAFFAVCSILVSVLAAWNITETQFPAVPATIVQVDTFLIVESILGMLVVFTVLPIELLSKTAVTSRVWFEVTWVALFFVLSISGAAASTATGPSLSCALSVRRSGSFKDACTSASVVQGFAWLCAVTLFFYLVALVGSTLLSASNNARIWHTAVRDVAWFATSQQELKSGPSSPTSRSFQEKQVPVYNVGIQPQAILYQKQTTKETLPEKPATITTPAVQRARASDVPTPQSLSDTPPLYPQLLPRLQTQAVAQGGSSQSASPSSDAPAPQSRAHSPSSSTSSSASSTTSTSSGGLKPLALQGSATPAPRPKPGSPKTKHRPPPLNLSGLSSFNSTGKRPDRAPRK